ncbi:NAD-dependent deacylase [Effusibacillus dendaii]|uniref:protein acetyllysine N-acetyltransferase n=1 Tax=Effusibacillus dendaii TaxID=2743772 RepID=A0A7I8DEG8_9BACL|nr:NAD-dependent deacylase [Effusibacillus dendaii]BCJ88543.1 NAD-dependent deacetylase [Effusibacillus dendaii]
MLSHILRKASSVVVFTGAGMSTESGLQDFRSADRGLWNNRNPMELASVEAMNRNRREFVRFYQWRIREMRSHQPNVGHHVLAKWEKEGLVKGIITQNVENYHELAGSRQIAKLHGNLGTLCCAECGRQYPAEYYLSFDPEKGQLPDCEQAGCGGFVRPNVVLFGEMLSYDVIQLADKLTNQADLFLVLGSSLQVYPANEYPMKAREQGVTLVIVNRDPTPFDRYADLVLHESIGEVLSKVDQELYG